MLMQHGSILVPKGGFEVAGDPVSLLPGPLMTFLTLRRELLFHFLQHILKSGYFVL